MFELAIGLVAALMFPIVVIIVHQRRDVLRNRRAGRRRNDRIRMLP